MSTGPPESATYRRALELVAAGRHEQALACLREYLLARPKDAHALNDAGAILYALGQHEQAARHLRIALDQLGGYPPQPVWNLAEVYLADAKTAELLALLDELRAAGALQTELANHVATRLIQGGDLAGGIEALLRSFQVSPRQDELMGLYQRARSARPKVAFFCDFGDPRFAEETLSGQDSHVQRSLGLKQARLVAESITVCLAGHWCSRSCFHDSPIGLLMPPARGLSAQGAFTEGRPA